MKSKYLSILDFLDYAYNKKFELLKIFFFLSSLTLIYFYYNYEYNKKIKIDYQIDLELLNRFNSFNIQQLNNEYLLKFRNLQGNPISFKKQISEQKINIKSKYFQKFLDESKCDQESIRNRKPVIICSIIVDSKFKNEMINLSKKINLLILSEVKSFFLKIYNTNDINLKSDRDDTYNYNLKVKIINSWDKFYDITFMNLIVKNKEFYLTYLILPFVTNFLIILVYLYISLMLRFYKFTVFKSK